LVEPDVVNQDVQRMPDPDGAVVRKAGSLEAMFHYVGNFGIFLDVTLGLVEDQVAGKGKQRSQFHDPFVRE
jgi:hypothetical protein